MLEDGLTYPTRGESWIARFLIGGVLSLLSFLILPAFIVTGYLVRALGSTIRGDPDPPDWEDWGGLLVDGLKATLVILVYAVVPFAVFGVLSSVLIGAGSAAGGDGGGLLAGFGLLTMLLMIPALFVVYYFIPAALGNMAREDSFGAAFDFAVIKEVALSVEYFVAVLLPIVVGIITNVITWVLAITVVGLVLVPFVNFYGQLAIFHMFGIAFRETADGADTSQSSAAAPASGF